MKKFLFFGLQLLSMFLFVLLLSGIFGIIKDVINNKKDLAFNLGYCFAAVLVFSALFWLNIKLYKFATKRNKEK
ncbi:hypothetical protein [Flavobacterium terrisoli]|uniref:hypothetical protein n=1 Tax=Flavobacterium terrisoli TaxID=3242195 RepID=UPI0025439DE2|nr:hypothetical protein [Flavobacterium buctense]